jgi:hypothetical protein
MRKDFEMTQEDLAALLAAMKPQPMIALQCGPVPSVQENANAAWARLGQRLNFDPMTVRPNGRGDRFFSAEVLPCRGMEIEPGVYSGCNGLYGECPECGK